MYVKSEEKNIKIYESEISEKYTEVSFNEIFELIKNYKIIYEVYKRRWYIITIIIMLLLSGNF